MPKFSLDRFRDLAFGRPAPADHPLRDEAHARRHLALLPEDDPVYALAELTHWTATMNATEAFTAVRRGEVLLLMHEAALPLWRALGQRYLAPQGRPAEGAEGDAALLRAMSDSASEFANGFAIVLDADEHQSKWLRENRAALMMRVLRWLDRRLALAYMQRGAQVAAIWERLHYRYADAARSGVLRTVLPPHAGARYGSSPLIEYARPLLLELAQPDALSARQVELVYRIAAWTASFVRLEPQPSDEANFAVVPARDERPVARKLLAAPGGEQVVYIATANCLARLRAALERDLDRDASDEDVLYGRGFTVGERRAMVKRALQYWGMDPPQRRTRRVAMAAPARVIAGFEQVLGVFPAPYPASAASAAASRRALQLKLDDTSQTLQRSKLRASRVGPARVIDASAGGLGLAIPRSDAGWAAHGELLAILIEPGTDWFLGVLRRIFSIESELRLGVQVLAPKPTVVNLRTDPVKRDAVWEEAMKFEATFRDYYRRGILLEPQALPLAGAEILLAPGLASRGTQFGVPLAQGEQRLRVTRIIEENKHYQRAMFESLGIA